MPLTVSQIAEQTGHAGDNRFVERLHYWTRERLLIPVGGARNPGTGKRRIYPDTAVQDAIVLNAMMEAGIAVAAQQLVMGTVRQERHLGWWKTDTRPFFLVIEAYEGGYGHPYFWPPVGSGNVDPLDFKINNRAGHTIVFNLTKLFTQNAQNETGGTNV
jgi:hypothetical protein